MGLFDKAADVWAGERADSDGLRAEVQRLGSQTLERLAAEVMERGFGRGGPGAENPADPAAIGAAFSGPFQGRDYDEAADAQLMEMVAEGIQVLEHACLVRPVFHGSGGDRAYYALDFASTRLGRAALEQHAVERILAGGSI
jgi:hypothetical protein